MRKSEIFRAAVTADGAPVSLPIGHLLVIAGASGAGKTTFINRLAAGKLPAEIKSHLPVGAETWTRLTKKEARRYIRVTDSCKEKKVDGAIVEFAIGEQKKVDCGYEELDRLFRLAMKTTVIHLRPTVEQILVWLACRQIDRRKEFAALLRLVTKKTVILLRPAVEQILNQLARRQLQPRKDFSANTRLTQFDSQTKRPLSTILSGSILKPTRRWLRQRRWFSIKSARYGQPGWLDDRYEHWENHLSVVTAKGAIIHEIFIEPSPESPPGCLVLWRCIGIRDLGSGLIQTQNTIVMREP